ncbi:ABC transporter ATP-binding protein [Halobacterium salinarum]|uniref:ABC transporter ATP-binding protein n=1 Tax=Halobacterium salinarum TaxID=2242 RepID=UPI00255676D4|nr:ABC transporter ATP-binding protein [Halobacterium salinarum]MDL0127635.1 ABC transporter ATP-binding protein [Halobacterium salinarum]MDL0135611.1 ABC transporter ATP-binding protein [Halobacterium salinarum]MDL0138714.1 ABC transporter ATP-binding protein [Halobacterium salinarum]
MGDRRGQTQGDDDTETSASAVVEASALSKSFGDIDVLDELSFSIPDDAVTAIVGPNGSGKTTLAELVTGVESPTAGELTLYAGGERPVGYLPQDPRFQPSATVRETVAFYAALLAGETDVDAALARVGLEAAADRRTDALSGGMRRLLGIAVSLLGAPDLVVLDEPTSGLDPEMTRHVYDVIAGLTERDQAVVLTTHDLSRAADADYILVVSDGSIVSAGSPEEVLADTETTTLEDAFEAAVRGRTVTAEGGDGRE